MKIDRSILEARIKRRIRFLESTLDPKKRELYLRVCAMIEILQLVLDEIEIVASERGMK